MDGASPAAVAGGRLRLVLRRGLLGAAIGIAAWLLSALFATSASAATDKPADQAPETLTETPAETPAEAPIEPPARSVGLLGGVTGTVSGVTESVAELAGTVVDTTNSLVAPVITAPAGDSLIDLPALLPAPDTEAPDTEAAGSAVTRTEAAVPPASLLAPPAAPALPVTEVMRPEPVRLAAPPPQPQSAPASTVTGNDRVVLDSGGDHQPIKAPAAPAGPAGSACTGFDHSGGVRGVHGVLTERTSPSPSHAGFTTRSRAVNAAGRTAGLPADSPD